MDQLLREEIRFLTTRLGVIIREQAGAPLFNRVEQLRRYSKSIRQSHDPGTISAKRRLVARLSTEEAFQVAHAFSLFFQLVNLCEERARIRHLCANPAMPQSLHQLFRKLKDAGVTAETLRNCLDGLEIQPVLTAHPTEAKRRTTLHHLLRLASHFDKPDEILETLWHTDEVRDRRVGPLDEVNNALFLLERTVFPAVSSFYAAFDEELRAVYPEVERPGPFLTFASWVGGDRDGHPFVTPEVSLATMERQRERLLGHYACECEGLISELTHSSPSPRLKVMPDDPFQPGEVYRRELLQIRRRLQGGYRHSGEFLRDLRKIQAGLLRQGAHRAAAGRIADLIEQARTFGFHLAQLDFRDHSSKLSESDTDILEELRTLRVIQHRHGKQAAHHFILSMTRDSRDIFRLLALAGQAGVSLDIVPLFETIGDLERARTVVGELWRDPGYRRHLPRRGGVQEIMLGYSDSNKDGGYLAANWLLYRTQRQLSELAVAAGIKLRFFHGKGGSIDRGGGMSHRSLLAHPHAAPGGRIRITEQGEVVSLKYSNPLIARRNLEQLTSAVIASQCLPAPAIAPEWIETQNQLARESFKFYQDLVYRAPEFPSYFRQATPIDLIEHLRLGSRPSRRSGKGDIRQLRAIPWVFAWTQSRHLLSAWYGMGYALENSGELESLREMYLRWPFFATLIDNAELSLTKTDLYIASRYASLVEKAAVRRKVFGLIEAEYRRTVRIVLAITQQSQLLANQPVLAESIRLRNPYIDPLNYLQIRFLRRWRQNPADEKLRRLLALTVNGIAFGMKSTG